MTYSQKDLPVGTRFLKDDMNAYIIKEWSPSGQHVKITPEIIRGDIWVESEKLLEAVKEILGSDHSYS